MLTGRQCRAARGLIGWTQADLGKAAGLSKTAINNFEGGITRLKQTSEESIVSSLETQGVVLTNDEGVKLRQDHVRIIRGEKPLVQLWDDILNTFGEGGEVLITHVNEDLGLNKYGDMLSHYIKELAARNITERLIAKEGNETFLLPKDCYRWIPAEQFHHGTATFIYGNKVAIKLWEESMILIIDSEDAADAERQRFETLWNSAQPFS